MFQLQTRIRNKTTGDKASFRISFRISFTVENASALDGVLGTNWNLSPSGNRNLRASSDGQTLNGVYGNKLVCPIQFMFDSK